MKSGLRIGLYSALVIVAVLLMYFILSPYWVLHQLKQAVAAEDTAKISQYIDYAQLRQNLKQQLEIAVSQEIRKIGDDNPFALLGAQFVNGVLDAGVEQLVQPQFLPFLLKGISLDVAQSYREKMPRLNAQDQQVNYQLNYQNWSRVQVSVRSDQQTQTTFDLARQGLSWKIVNVQLPKSQNKSSF